MKKLLNILLLIAIIALHVEAKTVSRTQIIMGTYINILVDKEDGKYIEDGFKIFKDVDASLSSFNKQSKIYKLNNTLHVEPDAYTYEALKLSQKYHKKTAGFFDVSVGSITKDLYRFGEDEKIPSDAELQKAKLGLESLHVENNRASIKKGMKIDLGGMGKGFAVDKVVEFYKLKGVKKGIISASGDIRCLSTCRMEVQNPFVDDSLVSFYTLKDDLGISTSGIYNRYVDTQKNNHLINPQKKQPQKEFISITLIGSIPNADLDAYTTAASVMPKEVSYMFLDSIGVGYIILESDKKLYISSNIEKYTKDLVVNYAVKK